MKCQDLAQRVFAWDAIQVVLDVPRRRAVRKSSFLEVCNTNEILTASVRKRSTEDDAARLEQLNTRAVLVFQRSCAFWSRCVCFWGYELSVHTTFEISRATGAPVTDLRHVASRFAPGSVRFRHVRSTTFVARCLLLGVLACSRGMFVEQKHLFANAGLHLGMCPVEESPRFVRNLMFGFVTSHHLMPATTSEVLHGGIG